MSRFLVTGASGFIGRALVRRLGADGHEVIAPRREDLDLLGTEGPDLAAWIAAKGPTHCIHAAWYTNHADYLTNDVNRAWVDASLRLADGCQNLRFVGLGTCLEYDVRSPNGPCREDTTPRGGETLYARSKLEVVDALTQVIGDFAWARLFFVYGPGDRAGRLVPAMLDKFRAGKTAGPTFGGLRRDYIHVDDLADQIVRIANSNVRGAINTGTGEAPTLSEIYAAGAAALGRPELAQASKEIGDQPPLIQADLAHFQRTVGDPGARGIAAGLRDFVR